jgi:hypothetical protein
MRRAHTEAEQGHRDLERAATRSDPGLEVDRSVLDMIHELHEAEGFRRGLPRDSREYEVALAAEAELRDRIRAWSDAH